MDSTPTCGVAAWHRRQPDDNAATIRAAVATQVLEKHGGGPVWNVPIPAVVTAAVAM